VFLGSREEPPGGEAMYRYGIVLRLERMGTFANRPIGAEILKGNCKG